MYKKPQFENIDFGAVTQPKAVESKQHTVESFQTNEQIFVKSLYTEKRL